MTSLMRRRPLWMTPFGESFGDVFSDRLWPESGLMKGEEFEPSMDFYEKDGVYHLDAELPGFNKDDIDISLKDGVVTVSGKKEEVKEEKKKNYYFKESRSGSFSRSFRLPAAADAEKVDAVFKDGVLSLKIPKEEEKSTKVKVN